MPIRSIVRRLTMLMAIAGCIVAPWLMAVSAQDGASDPRQRLVLPAQQRDGVLAEMRLMLGAMSGVIDGLSRNDPKAAAEAARSAGMTVAVDTAPQLQALLPPEFRDLGMATHRSFDSLADRLAAGATTSQALSGLADITRNCIGCHATYRIDEAR